MTPFNQQEHLALINEMIVTARKEIRDNGFHYLLWGYLVFVASLAQFILIMLNYTYNYLPWLLMPVGAVIAIVAARREKREQRVKTWVDKMMGYIWTAFGVSLFIVLFFLPYLKLHTMPFVLLLYGIGTFISGGALSFRPLIYGGILCWALAVTALFVNFEYQVLLIAVAVLVSYIIPGHILKERYNNV